jgi:hypothetical protein
VRALAITNSELERLADVRMEATPRQRRVRAPVASQATSARTHISIGPVKALRVSAAHFAQATIQGLESRVDNTAQALVRRSPPEPVASATNLS